jgi:hypothetical protein
MQCWYQRHQWWSTSAWDRLVLLEQIGSIRLIVVFAGLELLDPDEDQVAREVVALAKTVQRLAAEVFLADAALELDAVCGVWPWLSFFKSPASWSIRYTPDVRPKGRTPTSDKFGWTPKSTHGFMML